MLKNLSNALVQLHKFQNMEQLWISFSFSDQKICSKKLWRKPTVMLNSAFKQNQTSGGMQQHAKKCMHSSR